MRKMCLLVSILLLISIMQAFAIDPKVDFYWEPTTPSAGELVHFYDNSTYSEYIVDWDWDFGDGYGRKLQNPVHVYEKPGSYLVILSVTWNISGNVYVERAIKQINVQNQPPVADAGPDQIVNKRTVTFDGSGSYDPDGEIQTYTWNFGDGHTGVGKIVQHTYAADGKYKVTLNVTDAFGAFDTDTCNVTVDTLPPQTTINITGDKGSNGWYVSNVTVTLTATDATSGVDKTYYRIDNGSWNTYTASFKISTEGIHSLQYYSEDKAGNKELVKNVTIKIDKTKPSVSIVTPEEKRIYIFGRSILRTFKRTIIIGKITVEANATDNLGIDIVKFYVDEEERGNATSPPYTWKWGGDFGRRELLVKAFDEAGLYESDTIDVTIFSLFKPREAEASLSMDNN